MFRPAAFLTPTGLSALIAGVILSAVSPAKAADAADTSKSKYTIIPGLKISPEIGIGLGTMVVNPASPRPGSRMEYRVLYTTRNQAEVRVSNRTRGFFGTPWEARFEASLQRFPDNYFGGGNDPADSNEVQYTPLGGYAFTEFRRPFPGLGAPFNLLLGARAEGWDISRIERTNGDPGASGILGPGVTGSNGGVSDLWETGVEYDSRDSKDVPSKGIYAAQRIGTSLASEFSFQSAETWVYGYRGLGRHWEFAGRLWQKTLFGDPPFFVEPNLGNEDQLRGVPHKRFRDKSAQLATAEVRFGFPLRLPLIASWLGKDWQVATFGETGRVGDTFDEASRGKLNYSGGVGGRLIFNDRVGCMRGDLGFSEHGMALIVKFNQAF
jgi:outer membrane protein assembly factor BamA